MISIFVPTTIFLQSVLGFSAIHAGLTLLPMSLASMVIAPLSGRLSDRMNGKYVLLFGYTAMGAGLALMIHALSLGDTSWSFTFPTLVVGIGLGATMAPMTAVAMRNVSPRLAGAASGFLNTIRQVGGALGSAISGALLVNVVAADLPTQAQAHVAQVPAPYRGQFIAGFQAAAHQAQSFGTGRQTASRSLPVSPRPRRTRWPACSTRCSARLSSRACAPHCSCPSSP